MHAEKVERLYLFNWSNSSHRFNSCQPAHILFGSIDASYSRAELPLKVFFYFSTETAMSSVSSAYLMLSAFCSQIFTPGISSKSRRTVSLRKLNTLSEKRIPVMLLFCFCVLFKFVLDVNFRSLFPGKIAKKTQVLTTTVKLQKRLKKFPRCKQLKNFFYEVFFVFYLPYLSSIYEKANCIALFWTGRPHSLGSHHFRAVWTTCLPHKGGGVA